MSNKYTYECNKCGHILNSDSPDLDTMCYTIVEDNPHGLCFGKYRRQKSIGNYMKLKRILNIK